MIKQTKPRAEIILVDPPRAGRSYPFLSFPDRMPSSVILSFFYSILDIIKMRKITLVFAAVFLLGQSTNNAADIRSPSPTDLLPDPVATLTARFGLVPAIGVHPRILIGPKEARSLQHLVQSTRVGTYVLGLNEAYLDTLHKSGKPLFNVYDHLVSGDPNASNFALNDWWKGQITFAVSMECYDAMLLGDEARGRRVGAALATLARFTKNWWANDSDLVNLAFGYDYDYASMTDEQRTIVRAAIAKAIIGKRPFGEDMPPDWRDFNWIPRGMDLMLCALAIEGEGGYESSIYPSSVAIMKDFLHYGITPAGGGLEEMHYFHFGMQYGALAMVAMARRGDNLFADTHYRALVNWLIASMEPFGDAFSMHQDTPNDDGGVATNYAIMKWVWPENQALDMVWRNRVGVGYLGLNYYSNWAAPLLFPIDPKGWPDYSGKSPQTKWGVDELTKPRNYPDPVAGIAELMLPLTYWDPDRGLLITRDKWGAAGTVLHFDISAQAIGNSSHYHSNSTSFTLSALGRKWAIDRGFHIAESKDSSLVLIDGRGQGFFPVGGKPVEYREEKNLTWIVGDASESYHWMTNSKVRIGSPALKGFVWEPFSRPDILHRFSEMAKTDRAHPWSDSVVGAGYTFRAPYNPVEKAFRGAAFRRGGIHSYVLIVDDIRKDDKRHQYDWLMALPDDLVVTGTRGDSTVILGGANPSDTRRLLIQMIGGGGGGEWELENYKIVRSPETGDTTSFGNGKRLKFGCQAIEPQFRVLLYPYRDGAELPDATLDRNSLSVRWSDQKDQYSLGVLPSGRTELQLSVNR